MSMIRSRISWMYNGIVELIMNIKCCKRESRVEIDEDDENFTPKNSRLQIANVTLANSMKKMPSHTSSFYTKSTMKTTSMSNLKDVGTPVEETNEPGKQVVLL